MTRRPRHNTAAHAIKPKHALATVVVMVLGTLLCIAQEPVKRHVTPVIPATNQVKPPPKGTNEDIIQQYISGDSAAAIAQLRRDSLRRVYKRYPRLTDVTVGVNLAEPLFMALGQSYASCDVNATLNLWNRVQPVVEVGLGWARNTPDGMPFTYKSKPSPYFKVGANYNFLFKSSPDYQVVAGIRLGYSPFSYEVTGARYVNSYWGEGIDYDITGEHSHALWGEAVVGLKVKLWDRLSMGWMLRYHGIMSYGKNTHSKPWFIPGYGPRSSSLGFSLGIYYTLPLHRTAVSRSTTAPSHDQNQAP